MIAIARAVIFNELLGFGCNFITPGCRLSKEMQSFWSKSMSLEAGRFVTDFLSFSKSVSRQHDALGRFPSTSVLGNFFYYVAMRKWLMNELQHIVVFN